VRRLRMCMPVHAALGPRGWTRWGSRGRCGNSSTHTSDVSMCSFRKDLFVSESYLPDRVPEFGGELEKTRGCRIAVSTVRVSYRTWIQNAEVMTLLQCTQTCEIHSRAHLRGAPLYRCRFAAPT
jgi:hypothetical protein